MRRVNGSSCILLRGTLTILLLLVVASKHYCHATRWHPSWDKNIKLFYDKLLNRELQSQLSKSRRSATTGTDDFPIPPNRDRNKKLMEPTTSEGTNLGGHSTSTAFRLRRKKRGSFRLKKRQIGVDGRVIVPLSYLDNYYALGTQRNNLLTDETLGNGRIYLGSPKSLPNEGPGDDVFQEAKRGSFRLKKIPEDAMQWFDPGAKRASFRLKRILDNYKDLLGSPSVGSSSSSAFRLKKRGGTSSFRLKRIDEEGNHLYYGRP